MDNNNDQSELLGKKIFFLYPSGSITSQVITELVQQEYEVYVSRSHNRLAPVLRKYPDSIVFINLDEGMASVEWGNWIHGLMTSLPKIDVGVMSTNTEDEFKDKFINEIKVSCGFLMLKFDMSKSIPIITEILKKVDAKGRRKYIRASMEGETTCTINLPRGSDYTNGVLKDISVVGFSCVFDENLDLKKNMLITNIQIRLQTMLLKVEAIVFGSRMVNNQKTYVLLFTQRIDPDIRTKIRKYIQQNLQSKMDQESK
jgi:hypothetical protein